MAKLKRGTYYIVSAVIENEIMFLRPCFGLWSHPLSDAMFFETEKEANRALRHAQRRFSKQAVKFMRTLSIDLFGDKENYFVEI